MMLLTVAVFLLVLGSSVWVLVDGFNLGIKAPAAEPGRKQGFLDSGPVGLFFACLLLWIVGFPAYLVKRRKHLAQVPASPLAAGGLCVACPRCGTSLSLSSDLLGRAVVCPGCECQFIPPGIPPQSWYRGHGPTKVGWAVYAVVLPCSVLLLSQADFNDPFRAARDHRSSLDPAALELKVRNGIQERLATNSATRNTEIKSLSLVRQTDDRYQGTLLTQTGGRAEENEVHVTLEGDGRIKWQLLPRHAPEARSLEWNRAEPDARKNGNIAVALQRLLRNPNCRTDAVSPAPALVVQTLPDYYGKPLKLSGKVYHIDTLSADRDFGKALGGKPGSELLLVCADKTVVDIICTTPNPKVKVGDLATVYGFAVGTVQVPNPVGGVVTRLALFGPEYDLAVTK